MQDFPSNVSLFLTDSQWNSHPALTLHLASLHQRKRCAAWTSWGADLKPLDGYDKTKCGSQTRPLEYLQVRCCFHLLAVTIICISSPVH